MQELGESLLHKAVSQLISHAIWHSSTELKKICQTNPDRILGKTIGSSQKMATQDKSQAIYF